jgi:hypothetical protein
MAEDGESAPGRVWRASLARRPRVEVAESSLAFDHEYKGSLYARGGVLDYWVLNLVDRMLEVYRERVTPLAAPVASVAVSHLLP